MSSHAAVLSAVVVPTYYIVTLLCSLRVLEGKGQFWIDGLKPHCHSSRNEPVTVVHLFH